MEACVTQEINETGDLCEVQKSQNIQETQKIERLTVILHEATPVILRLFPCEVTQVALTVLLQKATQVIKNCLIRGDSSTELPEVGQ